MHQILVEYLLNAAWQVPLVAAGAVIVFRFGDLAPRVRNLASLAFLVMAVVSPALPLDLPSPGHESAARAASPAAGSAVAAPALTAANLARVNPWRLLRIGLDRRSAALIKIAFATATAIGLARLALSGLAAQRLARRSVDMALPEPLAGALEQFMRAHGRGTPRVRRCAGVASPVVLGVLNPVILVPECFAELARDDQRAALLHECAHVVRRDYAVNLLGELLALPLNWHPALYPIKVGVRRSREMACDAMAAAAMASQEVYAQRLLSLAKSLGAAQARGPSLALVGLFGKSSLEERLMHLLDRKAPERSGMKSVRFGAAAMVTTLALTPVMLFRVAPVYAQTPAAASTPAVPAAPVAPAVSAAPAQAVRTHTEDQAGPPMARREPSFVQSVTMDRGQRIVTGVLIEPDGRTVSVVDRDVGARAEAARRRVREALQHALRRSAAAGRLADSPEFKQKMADLAARQSDLAAIDHETIRRQVEAANAAVKAARVQADMARAQARTALAEVRESLRQAEQVQRAWERSARDAARSDEAVGRAPI